MRFSKDLPEICPSCTWDLPWTWDGFGKFQVNQADNSGRSQPQPKYRILKNLKNRRYQCFQARNIGGFKVGDIDGYVNEI